MAVMEMEEADMTERVVITDEQDEVLTDKKAEVVEESKEEIEKKRELRELKKNWAKMFLSQGGVTYAVEQLHATEIKPDMNYTLV